MSRPRVHWASDAREKLLNDDTVTTAVEDTAEAIVREIEQLAPQDSGDYVAGIEIVDVVGPDGVAGRTIRATDVKSAYIEYGTGPRETEKGADRGEMPAYHVLSRAAEAAGLAVRPR